MNLKKQQIEAITLKIAQQQKKNFEVALNSDELLMMEVNIREEFNKSVAKKKIDALQKAQKIAGDLDLLIRINESDCKILTYGNTQNLEEWNKHFEVKIKEAANKRLKDKYCTASAIIEQQIVLATIDSSTLEELIQKVTLALTA